MASTKDTLFAPFATGDDVSHFFVSPSADNDNTLFSTHLPKHSPSFPPLHRLAHHTQDFPTSTLFGPFSETAILNDDAPSSPTLSSILSLDDEVTYSTIPDDDDIWADAEHEPKTDKIKTWEGFGASRGDVQVGGTPFVTEIRPAVFDELLRRHMNHFYAPSESGIVVDELLFREVTYRISYVNAVSSFCLCRL